jgi:C4-dicarboxylate-specific signal transduction histidine kinase
VTQAQAYKRLVLNSQATSSEIEAGFEAVAEQALGIAQVVKRIRAFVTKRESVSEVVDLEQTLLQVTKLIDLDARRREVALEVKLAGNIPVIMADSVQIQQVILNLVRNAMDAVSQVPTDSRKVVIQTLFRQNKLSLEVSDRGQGVSVESQKKLFLPFFTTKSDGLGLGLSLSQSIIEAHGGTLTYRENPGGGSIFEVCFITTPKPG